ncbi:PAS domain S-box protein [Specibacter sp. NPDC078692]|uniref:PAS domain S-box protein n=1 Tax=Specibacter sp. NPDC078692 TaxID=3155818 RepID=UPI0034126C2D
MSPKQLGIDSWPQNVAARLLDLSVDLSCVIGFDGHFREAAGDWEGLLGWTPTEMLSLSLTDLMYDADAVATFADLESIRAGSAAVRFQNRVRAKDGTLRWLLWTVTAIPVEQAYRAVACDVTPGHDAEALVLESERRYQDLIESAHDIVQSILPDGHFQFVNRAWHELLGYTTEELPGLTLFDIVDKVDHDHCTLLIGQLMSGMSFDSVEVTFVAKDGHTFPVEGNATGRFREGEYVATHTFFRDVSDRKQAQALTAAYQHQLEDEVAERSNINVRCGVSIDSLEGTDRLEGVLIRGGEGSGAAGSGAPELLPASALFVFIGASPRTDWLPPQVLRDSRGFILTGPALGDQHHQTADGDRDPFLYETSAAGVFAVGDVRAGSLKRVASAVGEGSVAVQFVHQVLRS